MPRRGTDAKTRRLSTSTTRAVSTTASSTSNNPGVIGNGDFLKVEHTASVNDIEDIVNLLEGAFIPKPRPQSIVSIPDENPDDY